jgi:hypothetical protein
MLYIIGPLFTFVLLFALCKTGERAMESQSDYWMRNHQALDRMRWGWSY